jgi:hypothetical protein
MLKLISELTGILIALVSGIYSFRYMKLEYRIFFFQLLAYILIYILANAVMIIQEKNKVTINNQWVYNLAMPIETGFLAWAACEYFKSSKAVLLICIGVGIFFIAFLTELFLTGASVFSNHGYIIESGLLLVLYLFVLYSQLTKQTGNRKRSPEVWISIGIVLYFGGGVPYLSLIHYLEKGHPQINLLLYRFIIEGLSNVRYILLGVGFWFVRRNVLSKISGLNG